MLYLLSLYECWNSTKEIEQDRGAEPEKGTWSQQMAQSWRLPWTPSPMLPSPTLRQTGRTRKRPTNSKHSGLGSLSSHGPEILFLCPKTVKHFRSIRRGFQHHPVKISLWYLPLLRYSEVYTERQFSSPYVASAETSQPPVAPDKLRRSK